MIGIGYWRFDDSLAGRDRLYILAEVSVLLSGGLDSGLGALGKARVKRLLTVVFLG